MPPPRVLLLITALALPARQGTAQTLTPRASIIEVLRTGRDVPVGGADLVGVAAITTNAAVNPDRLRVFLPGSMRGSLCVAIRSRDGQYEAHGEFGLDGGAAGSYGVNWPTRYADALRTYSAEELAVVAAVRSNCAIRDTSQTMLVTTWEADQPTTNVTMLFNVGDVDQVMFGTRDGVVRVPCGPALPPTDRQGRSTSGVAFNTKCMIPLERGKTHLLRLSSWHFESRSTLDFRLSVP